MKRETKPCPFYGMPCEYVPMADIAVEQTSEIATLRTENERLSSYAKRAAMDVLLCKDGNILLHEENERLRSALGDIHAAAGNNHLIANIARAALGEKQ